MRRIGRCRFLFAFADAPPGVGTFFFLPYFLPLRVILIVEKRSWNFQNEFIGKVQNVIFMVLIFSFSHHLNGHRSIPQDLSPCTLLLVQSCCRVSPCPCTQLISLAIAMAAIVPSATAVVICLYFLLITSPTAKMSGRLVRISSSVLI